jgi:hypothetical protein
MEGKIDPSQAFRRLISGVIRFNRSFVKQTRGFETLFRTVCSIKKRLPLAMEQLGFYNPHHHAEMDQAVNLLTNG